MGKALLVIDMQNGICTADIYKLNQTVVNINNRIKYFRNRKLPIIFIQHNDQTLRAGSHNWEIMSQIDYFEDEDITIQKTHADAFYKTKLKEKLEQLQINELEVTGAQTEYCVDTTIRVAHNLGYEITMYQGTTTTFDNEFLPAARMVDYYYKIWNQRFLTLK